MRQTALEGLTDERSSSPVPEVAVTDLSFRCGDRSTLRVGDKTLAQYLKDSRQQFFLRAADAMDRVDVSELMRSYSSVGRHAIHPRILLGLIVFGILMRKSSLRELEQLAQCDVRGWWICRGVQPDHSTIGKFFVAHAAWIEGPGFQAVLKQAVAGLGLKPSDAAIDGTVIQSAASHLHMLKKDAARAVADEAAAHAAAHEDDEKAQRDSEHAQKVADVVEERTEAREQHGRPADHTKVAPSDPDAVNQPRKDDLVRPSFKPSVITNADQLILGQHVDPSSETAAVGPLLEQHTMAAGAAPQTALLDAGYHSVGVLALMLAAGIDILCPSGRATGASDVERASRGKFAKHLFVFQPEHDVYRCPQGQALRRLGGNARDRDGKIIAKYGGAPCAQCPERARCTDSRQGRTIQRYDGDELKEAMREVMQQPAARAKYRQRSVMVEPVFARLRDMGLQRFRRRGLGRVRAEFALFCMAYNVKRADAIREARIAAFLLLRVSGAPIALVLWIVR